MDRVTIAILGGVFGGVFGLYSAGKQGDIILATYAFATLSYAGLIRRQHNAIQRLTAADE